MQISANSTADVVISHYIRGTKKKRAYICLKPGFDFWMCSHIYLMLVNKPKLACLKLIFFFFTNLFRICSVCRMWKVTSLLFVEMKSLLTFSFMSSTFTRCFFWQYQSTFFTSFFVPTLPIFLYCWLLHISPGAFLMILWTGDPGCLPTPYLFIIPGSFPRSSENSVCSCWLLNKPFKETILQYV